MFHRKGGDWARDLEPGSLTAMLEGALAASGIEAPIAWEKTGQLGTAALMSQWPNFLDLPAAVFLRRSARKPFGLELSVDIEGDLEVQEYGEDLRRYLMGEGRLTEFQAAVPVNESDQVMDDVEAAEPPEPVEPTAKATAAPSHAASKAPVEEESPSDEAAPPAVEVFGPGERVHKAKGRTWSQAPDDLFGLAGEVHPDDLEDHSLEISVKDLPWLNPGDAIISPRRGPCRIKRVEDDARQVVAKDEHQQMLVLAFDELLAEFQFDDGN
ncbi:MAG: hypothetical protein QF489_07905 [Planctomycetota bacterium]|jgi:hypothetical protein|nr:hypothetical protein [Planctomycetota bacterium]